MVTKFVFIEVQKSNKIKELANFYDIMNALNIYNLYLPLI